MDIDKYIILLIFRYLKSLLEWVKRIHKDINQYFLIKLFLEHKLSSKGIWECKYPQYDFPLLSVWERVTYHIQYLSIIINHKMNILWILEQEPLNRLVYHNLGSPCDSPLIPKHRKRNL